MATVTEQQKTSNSNNIIVVAGANGTLGNLIVSHLVASGAAIRALVRRGNANGINDVKASNLTRIEVDYNNADDLVRACSGASCVVSALSGLEDVIVDAQIKLLDAAVVSRVPRFIPSDYCIDYTKLTPGGNRNLDLRRTFMHRLDKAPIKATSILNGMFTDLLTGQAPLILFGLKRVIYWGNVRQLLDFTTTNDTAAYTAAAALDVNTPRFLRIAGEVTTVDGLRSAASKVTGKDFSLFRVGGLGALRTMIKITRTLFPQKQEVFPAWQGMQYLHDMFTGLPKLDPLDNNRYPIQWTCVADVLAKKDFES